MTAANGRNMEKPKLSFRVEPELKAAVEAEAKNDDRSPSWMANHLLKLGLEAKQQDKKKKKAA